MRAALLLLAVAACEPAWGVSVRAKYPNAAPVEDATVAIACDTSYGETLAVRTAPDGAAHIRSLGSSWPVGCDVFVAKPGFETHRIRYRDLCPNGPEGCERVFAFDLVLAPARQ